MCIRDSTIPHHRQPHNRRPQGTIQEIREKILWTPNIVVTPRHTCGSTSNIAMTLNIKRTVNGILRTHSTNIRNEQDAEPMVTTSSGSTFCAGSSAYTCLLYTSPSPRDRTRSRMPSSA
eukprot:TRINITY_DN18068_c0_g1_i1.p1 TRINITY_DN18068_c0_g1~~TRINITY_DN18068_c0_g1_i1.p1  ORF type:complete len:119 (-),score=0.07 TRINITY_DN18068_c0_g1_i1:17-373(-)